MQTQPFFSSTLFHFWAFLSIRFCKASQARFSRAPLFKNLKILFILEDKIAIHASSVNDKNVTMPQISFPKAVSDRLLQHIDKIHNGQDPDKVARECIQQGIAILQRNGRTERLLEQIEARYPKTPSKKISHTEIEDIGTIFNGMKISFELSSRRHLKREAILAYAKEKGLL